MTKSAEWRSGPLIMALLFFGQVRGAAAEDHPVRSDAHASGCQAILHGVRTSDWIRDLRYRKGSAIPRVCSTFVSSFPCVDDSKIVARWESGCSRFLRRCVFDVALRRSRFKTGTATARRISNDTSPARPYAALPASCDYRSRK